MKTQTLDRSQDGFSLLEVLIAVAIIALMAGAAAVALFPELLEGRRTRALNDIKNLQQAVKLYQMKEGKLPNESEWPRFLVEGSEKRRQPYLEDGKEPIDPWGNQYVYKRIDGGYEILSYGADGSPGGEEDDADISSRDEKK